MPTARNRRRTGELPVAARAGLLVVLVAFGIWLTVGPIHARWDQALVAAGAGLVIGAVAVRFGPQRALFHNLVRLGIFVVFLALIPLRDVVGGVAFAWLFAAAVGMNLGSGGWTRAGRR